MACLYYLGIGTIFLRHCRSSRLFSTNHRGALVKFEVAAEALLGKTSSLETLHNGSSHWQYHMPLFTPYAHFCYHNSKTFPYSCMLGLFNSRLCTGRAMHVGPLFSSTVHCLTQQTVYLLVPSSHRGKTFPLMFGALQRICTSAPESRPFTFRSKVLGALYPTVYCMDSSCSFPIVWRRSAAQVNLFCGASSRVCCDRQCQRSA